MPTVADVLAQLDPIAVHTMPRAADAGEVEALFLAALLVADGQLALGQPNRALHRSRLLQWGREFWSRYEQGAAAFGVTPVGDSPPPAYWEISASDTFRDDAAGVLERVLAPAQKLAVVLAWGDAFQRYDPPPLIAKWQGQVRELAPAPDPPPDPPPPDPPPDPPLDPPPPLDSSSSPVSFQSEVFRGVAVAAAVSGVLWLARRLFR
jgi:hypothetical protein